MSVTTIQDQKVFQEFKVCKNRWGIESVFVLRTYPSQYPNQVNKVYANHEETMRTLAERNLRPLSIRQALFLIADNQNLSDEIEGARFYLKGKGLRLHTPRSINENGELVKLIWEGEGKLKRYPDPDTIATFNPGNNPIYLIVNKGYIPGRFSVHADIPPSQISLAVVGVKIRSKLLADAKRD